LKPSTNRRDVPAGQVPDYRSFVRHVWTFVNEDGSRPILKAPVMYEQVFVPEDGILVRDAIGFLRAFLDKHRLALFVDGASLILQVYDLDALHALAMALSSRISLSDRHRAVAESLMWSLGFRWITEES